MTDEPRFPARRGPAADGYRMLFLAPRPDRGKGSPGPRRDALRAADPAARRPEPRKAAGRAAH